MNTADERGAHGKHGEADLLRSLQGCAHARHARFDVPADVLDDHDRIIDDEAGRHGQRHQREIVQAESQEIDHPERADQGERYRDGRHQRRSRIAQHDDHHRHDEQQRHEQRDLDVMERSADCLRAVVGDDQIDARRDGRADLRQRRLDAVHRVDDVRARLLADDHEDRALAVGQAEVAHVLDTLAHRGDIPEVHRGAIAVRDDERAVLRRGGRRVVDVDLVVVRGTVDRPFGGIGIGRGNRGPDVLEPDAVLEERLRVEVDPHRRQRAAADRHIADALDLQQLLLNDRRGGIVDRARAQRVGGEREDDDRRIGGIEGAVGRVLPQRPRQVLARRLDGGLDIALGAVDVAVEVEDEHDPTAPLAARGGHLVDPGDAAQMPLERRGHGGRDRLRARPGQLRHDHDGRHVDLRHVGHRQQEIGEDARERQPAREQCRGDGTQDERAGDVQGRPVSAALRAGAAMTARPTPRPSGEQTPAQVLARFASRSKKR